MGRAGRRSMEQTGSWEGCGGNMAAVIGWCAHSGWCLPAMTARSRAGSRHGRNGRKPIEHWPHKRMVQVDGEDVEIPCANKSSKDGVACDGLDISSLHARRALVK